MKSPSLKSLTLIVTALAFPALMAQDYSPAQIQEGLDASFGPWESQELGHWANQSEVTLDGVDAVRVVRPSTSASPFLLRATLDGPTTVHFSYLCGRNPNASSSGPSVQAGAGAATLLPFARFWQEASIEVGAGSQVVTWKFPRDGTDGFGFLDQVWTEDDPRPRVTSPTFVDGQKGSAILYQIATNKPCEAFAATGLPPGVTVDTATGLINGTPTELGSFNARVEATNSAGSHVRSVLFRVLNPSASSTVDLAVALDDAVPHWSQRAGADFEPWAIPGATWWGERGATEAWTGALTSLAKDGVDATTFVLRTDPERNTASNWLKADVQGPGTFSFWHRMIPFPNDAGEMSDDNVSLSVRIDGTINFYVIPGRREVNSEWTQRTFEVPPGHHTFEFLLGHESYNRRQGDALVLFDQASFTPQPRSFTLSEWLQTVAGSPNRNATEDLEQDGLALLLEYALGGSPIRQDRALLPEVAIIDGHLTMTVHKAPGTSGLEYTVQANKSLAGNGWTTFGTEIMNEDADVLVVRCKKTLAEEPTCMLRLRVRIDD